MGLLDDLNDTNRIPVISPDGKFGTIDRSELAQANGMGYREATGAEVLENKERFDYQNMGPQAFGMGALRSLTFGISDVVAKQIWDARKLNLLRDENQAESLVGEIVGAVVPALASAGAGAAGTLGKLTAPGAIATGSKEIAKRVFKSGSPVLRGTAEAAVEGAVWGAQPTITEATLGDPDEVAEHLISGVGLGALFGGVLGAAGSKIMGSDITKRLKKIDDIPNKIDDGISVGVKKSGLAEKYASKILDDPDAEQIENYSELIGISKRNRKARELLFGDVKTVEQAGKDLGKSADIMMENFNKITKEIIGEKKKAKMAAKIAMPNSDATTQSVIKELGNFKKQLGDMAAANHQYGFQKFIEELNESIKVIETKLVKNFESKSVSLGGDMFDDLDNLKRSVGRYGKRGKNSRTLNDKMDATLDVLVGENGLGGWYDRLRLFLERDDLWGKNAAMAQKGVNNRWVNYLFDDNYRGGKKFFIPFGTDGIGENLYRADPKAFKSLLTELSMENSLDVEYMLNKTRSIPQMIDEIKKHYDINYDIDGKAFKDILNDASEYSEIINKEMLEILDAHEAIRKTGFVKPPKNESGAGWVLSGILSNAAAAATTPFFGPAAFAASPLLQVGLKYGSDIFFDPTVLPTMLNKFDGVMNGVSNKISGGVKKMMDISYKSRKAVIPVTTILGHKLLSSPKKKETKEESFMRLYNDINHLTTNPEQMVQTLGNNLGQVSRLTPQVSQAMAMHSVNRIRFLNQKLPSNPYAGTPYENKWKPSPTEISKFARTYNAINNPLSILDSVAEGTVNSEELEVLMGVFPSLYNKLQFTLTDNFQQLMQLPYRKRKYLAELFQLPLVVPSQIIQERVEPRQMVAKPLRRKLNLAPEPLTVERLSSV